MLFTVRGTGRVVANAEIKVETEKSKLVEFRVANAEKIQKNGEWVEETTFTTCKAWLPLNSKLPDFLRKGTLVEINGELAQENWETDGQKRSKLVVKCRMGGIGLLSTGNKGDNSEKPASTPAPQTQTPQETPTTEAPQVDIDDDEIPF